MSRLSEFLLQCSGVDREILRECPTDENKYIGIGGTVLFTGILAFFSSAYAIYTVFDSYFMAVVFGAIWGLMIFNLDRYIVSSMKSRGSLFRDFMVAFPRLVMAVLLALVISKPLELKIFEKEINAELITMEQEVFQEQEDKVWSRYNPQIVAHKADIPLLQAEIDQATALRDTLAMMAIQEADGTGGSGHRNLGPIYRTKKAQADKAQADLETVEARVLPLIAQKQQAIADLEQQAEADIAALDRQAYGGMAARMDALHRLGQASPAIYYASIFITLLFIALETAPVFVKLISSRSPYDYLLHEREHVFAMNNLEQTTLLSNAVKNKIKFDTESSIYRTQKELEVERELTDEYLQRKKAALADRPLDWELPFVKGNLA
ncbi:DUF4407 domain-containing protein [Flavilitoribacter nigricans]|uniref:DUF4407 domain-containing protein n=1 Tax=Flavilitoribacter nigricans (strain ATCC 23147 / DSM 23189 / NBRC 102662 / NCIMB 1420 / SS-2) TaxID=1122177 RepID=A0A2D0N1H1_FLAN2|nr:DUF4407 domain-containing protein [Flavilitoribacter nigricans]PHN02280.1 hypothetical protein CRP01_32800 [Flavilitoribacter nigricans DSM 23189 = NBRC 102662]